MVARLPPSARQRVPWRRQFVFFLPVIRRYGEFAFRCLRSEEREEAMQEMVVLAFVAFARLVERGEIDRAYPSVLARFAVAQVRDGRKAATPANTHDVLSRRAQCKGGFAVERLDRFDGGVRQWLEVLVADRCTPVPNQAAFRIDFAAWLLQLPTCNRRIADFLMTGNSTNEVARLVHLSAGRISQLRRELHANWERFQNSGARNDVPVR
ncbi:hypothetical protein Pan216_04040 [Planctomycetes bacterium Pan216]|uniref:Uncharacterized protein n=1 Tax=Kolteria novifilia TaxID=2527975 RepID=A0A518AXY8_9BACT|nr:hypothetical protein Pan216_04040 [Planctomycetes bacterium Pan216]